MRTKLWCLGIGAALVMGVFATGFATDVTVYHYWTSTNWRNSFIAALDMVNESLQDVGIDVTARERIVEHEDFKTKITLLIQQADTSPDLFSYWEGARTQFLADAGLLHDLSDYWEDNNLDDIMPPAMKDAATYLVDGETGIYNIPFVSHIAVVIYNPHIFERAGVTPPTTWEEFLDVCDAIKGLSTPLSPVYPLITGVKYRWPAQFWFDYLLLRTAGFEFREALMRGEESYMAPEVIRAFEMWSDLLTREYFLPGAASYDWQEVLTFFLNGQGAMYLMGDWVFGDLNGLGLEPGVDYDYFEFPMIEPDVEQGIVGPIDGFVVPALAPNKEGAYHVLNQLLTDPVQELYAPAKGGLSVTKTASPDFNVVQAREVPLLANTPFYAFNYDLATPPPVADVGLNAFVELWNNPSDYLGILTRLQARIDSENLFDK